MSEPTTETGRRLFTDNEPMDMLESDGVTWGDVVAIEAEARASQPLTLDSAARQVEQSRYAIRHGSVGGPSERVASAALDALRSAREMGT